MKSRTEATFVSWMNIFYSQENGKLSSEKYGGSAPKGLVKSLSGFPEKIKTIATRDIIFTYTEFTFTELVA